MEHNNDGDYERLMAQYPAQYTMDDEQVGIPMTQNVVSYYTAVYVKGHGTSLRATAVPGSDAEQYMRDSETDRGCDCSGPAVWTFIYVDPSNGKTAQLFTLNVHSALFWLQHPDTILEYAENQGLSGYPMGTFGDVTRLIPVGEPLGMVVAEFEDWLATDGGPTFGGDRITAADVLDADIVAAFEKFLEQNPGGE